MSFYVNDLTKKEFGLGNVKSGEGSGGIERNVLQTFCPGADISSVTDAEILTIATQKAAKYVDNVADLKDTKSITYTNWLKDVGEAVCQVANAKKTTATSTKFTLATMPDWFKWLLAASGASLVIGAIAKRRKK